MTKGTPGYRDKEERYCPREKCVQIRLSTSKSDCRPGLEGLVGSRIVRLRENLGVTCHLSPEFLHSKNHMGNVGLEELGGRRTIFLRYPTR